MQRPRTLILLTALLLSACSGAAGIPADCPVTQATGVANSTYGDPGGLQVLIHSGGIWRDLPYHDGHYSQKVWWTHPDYDWLKEPMPKFNLIGEQLDGDGYFEVADAATNAQLAELGGSAILTGANIPDPGCWQLTGIYQNSQLSFVVYVED